MTTVPGMVTINPRTNLTMDRARQFCHRLLVVAFNLRGGISRRLLHPVEMIGPLCAGLSAIMCGQVRTGAAMRFERWVHRGKQRATRSAYCAGSNAMA